MGRRELLLIVAFIFVGTLLYQATAPPAPDGGFSWSGFVQNLRRHVGPRHEYLADERTEKLPLEEATTEVRVTGVQSLRIEGTDAREGSIRLQVYSTGTDEKEARALGKRTALQTTSSGDILSLEMDYPPEERQRTMMTLTLPRALRVRITRASTIEVSGIAGVELDGTRGDARFTKIAGTVRGTHTGGEMTADTIKDIDLTVRRSDVTIKNVTGNVRLDLTGGQVVARDIAGNVGLTSNRASIELDAIGGTVTADLTQGSLDATRLAQQARVDARGTELRLELAKPAAVTAMTTDENITVRLPEQAGLSLDATVEDGEIRVPEHGPQPSTSGQTSRARGPINGGGPTLALRTSHADIIVR